jgi:hypothetical protein
VNEPALLVLLVIKLFHQPYIGAYLVHALGKLPHTPKELRIFKIPEHFVPVLDRCNRPERKVKERLKVVGSPRSCYRVYDLVEIEVAEEVRRTCPLRA